MAFASLEGCSVADLSTTERMNRGVVIILPGIEGRSFWNVELARGLDEGGVRAAIEIFDWGTDVPGGMFINLTDYERNRAMAGRLHDRILSYEADHPHRPIHLVGHSGGAGVAVMAAEQLPENRRISSLILLAAALSPTYDLLPAMRRTRYGVFNYYSGLDAVFLRAGTTVAGTIDRSFGQAAGATGFEVPLTLASDGEWALYRAKLHQIRWEPGMQLHGHFGGHMDWTNRAFVKEYLAPLIISLSRA